jgi:8-oxo-dGTP pyrophosphatase MutT (NUDIX family)
MADHNDAARSPVIANVIVTSQSPAGVRVLVLHPSDIDSYDGDWSWGPAGGNREPGEDIADCAARELFEETGIVAFPQPVETENVDIAIYHHDVAWGTPVRLSLEHTDYEWVDVEQAVARCKPEALRSTMITALSYAGLV